MKNRSYLVWLLLLGFILPITAQQQMQPLPIDPKVRYGKLANGLTYYIRHNEQPKERADFYIAQRVGSMQEEDNQAGLAHFLEHMAFNGTKNFPGHGIDDFTESVGIRGGENLNAYTSFDETVYMIMNAPVNRREVVDSCLLILHDWSGFIALEDSAIEKERGVIREEWRTRQDAQARLWEQQLPKMFPGSRYANRMPIGSIDVINNFKYDEIRAYYKKWYRPDLQAVIIVGDVDVDQVENSLKQMFTDIPKPVNPAERVMHQVPDNDLPLVSVATDKEASNTILYLFYKHDKLPRDLYATPMGLVMDYIRNVASSMMNDRFNELLQKGNPPFVDAQASDGEYMIAKSKDAWTVACLAKEDHINEALTAMVVETQRLKKFGFTASEYERARINVLKNYETHFNERDKQKNDAYTNEYVTHFTDGGYIPGIETEYALINQIAPGIPVEQINQYIQDMIGDKNIVISLTGPEKAGLTYPTEDDLLRTFMKAQKQEVEAYKETVSNEPLIAREPTPGTILKEEKDPLFGTTVLTLGNGVKVVVKPTELKKDEVLMTATSPGGSSLFGKEDAANLKLFNDVIGLGGLGNFSAVDLPKVLAGKKASVSASLGMDNESLNGQSTPADLKTLFQLIYLQFTALRPDAEAYTSFEGRTKAQLKNYELNPMVAFSDTITKEIYNNNPRTVRLKESDFEKINYQRILDMYKERFADASDFTFTFVGNINQDSLKLYAKQYLATLPSLKRVEKGNVNEVPAIRKGSAVNHFARSLQTPKASVVNFFSGELPYTLENRLTLTMFKQILDLVYMEKVREDEGGTYGVQTSAQISSFPEGRTVLQTYFDTDPAKRAQMNSIVHNELKRIAETGPRPEDFNKTKENLLKKHAEALQENSYWLNTIDTYYFKKRDDHSTYDATLNAITPTSIQNLAKSLLKQGNTVEVVMEPSH